MKRGAILALLALVAGCSKPEEARQVLAARGFTNVETHGTYLWACGRWESWPTEFSATDPAGKAVRGAVCFGWILGKPEAIRIDL